MIESPPHFNWKTAPASHPDEGLLDSTGMAEGRQSDVIAKDNAGDGDLAANHWQV
jgi:hypothetical protein